MPGSNATSMTRRVKLAHVYLSLGGYGLDGSCQLLEGIGVDPSTASAAPLPKLSRNPARLPSQQQESGSLRE